VKNPELWIKYRAKMQSFCQVSRGLTTKQRMGQEKTELLHPHKCNTLAKDPKQ